MIDQPIKCPYCGKDAELMESSASVYHGKDYGPIWICIPCQAWCGCHPDTTNPLGRLANADLRRAKMAAHAAFDPTWKTRGYSRATAYEYLAQALGINPGQCHIGMFDLDMCMKVVAVCPLTIPDEHRLSARAVNKKRKGLCQYPTNVPGRNCGQSAIARDEDLGIWVCEEHR